VSSRRPWAALLTLCSALVLAAASAAEQPSSAPGVRPLDAGVPARATDAGVALSAAAHDAGQSAAPLGLEDLEVLENLELLEHLPESDVLELLLPVGDE
jgi:hypothetical protein